MLSLSFACAAAVLIVCGYYLFIWLQVGRDREAAPLVPLYAPPRDLSPAMIRYIWKESFDDRTFWAAVLSLVSKGIGTLQTVNGVPRLTRGSAANDGTNLPPEEELLLSRFNYRHGKQGIPLTLLDDLTAHTAYQMANSLRERSVGKWFEENRNYVNGGAILSFACVCFCSRPQSIDDWEALLLALVAMAPAAFYLIFVLLRLADLFRAARHKLQGAILRRALLFFMFLVPCLAGILLGAVVLIGTFGIPPLITTLALVALNVSVYHFMRLPTPEGRKLLHEIAGFRHFLKSVEKSPMDLPDAPHKQPGIYEKYLPYAVALDVDQSWSDRFVAISSTDHQGEAVPNAATFYLGMWDGKPVEITYWAEGRHW